MDVFSKAKRSQIMAAIRGTDTGPEIALRRVLHRRGLRYSLHPADLPGRPDVAFRRARVAVFVHGCFWHQHSCGRGTRPRAHAAFWRRKLAANVARDARDKRQLREMHWRAVVVWECQVQTPGRLLRACERVANLVRARETTRSWQ